MSESAAEDPRVGALLAERYRIDALVGEGGMGKVYAAEHVLMKKRLAVKVLHRELTSIPDVVARFEREAMAAANIDHPNVAAATDFGKLRDGSVFLVLEYVEGKSLRDEIAHGPLAPARALHIARQIASGLGNAHRQGIVHRDLKPENVMLVTKGADPDFVKVLDFGIAKVPIGEVAAQDPDQLITRAGMVFGTPEYMAPEQALGQTVDGRADLYALGVILFEMLAGIRPFKGANAVAMLGQQLANPPPSLAERAPFIPVSEELERALARLLAPDRDQRFPDAAAVVSVLDTLLESGFPRERLDPIPTPLSTSTPALESTSVDLPPLGSSALPEAPVRILKRVRGWFGSRRVQLLGLSGVGLVLLGVLLANRHRAEERIGSSPSSDGTRRAQDSAPSPQKADPHVEALEDPGAPPAHASPAELERASKLGPSAFDTLADRYPADPNPRIEAARARVWARDFTGAIRDVRRALATAPEVQADERLAEVLYRTAQSSASIEESFAVLTGPMGPRGAELLWDLADDRDVLPLVQQRAGAWLRSPEFRQRAPEALLLAANLRTVKTCEAAHALLGEAVTKADARSLSQLLAWRRTTGCGKGGLSDCMPCLRKDDRLERAIAAVTLRTRTKKPE